jgi:ATP-dependent Clp protease adaptor protein ClpS
MQILWGATQPPDMRCGFETNSGEDESLGNFDSDTREGTIVETRKKVTEPPMYKVLLHNDDYTPREFVVEILMSVFNKSMNTAVQLMWHVHEKGVGLIEIYTYQVAESKIKQTSALAREHGFPLKTTMEQE